MRVPERTTPPILASAPNACAIERIAGVWKFTRPPGTTSKSNSTHGHLIHWMARGRSRLWVNGREYLLTPGDLFYYHQRESVLNHWGPGEVVYYSVCFMAPQFQPPPLSERHVRLPSLSKTFTALYRDSLLPGGEARDFRLYGHLFRILAELSARRLTTSNAAAEPSEWWAVENALRLKRNYRLSLSELLEIYPRSAASLDRACRRATGVSVTRRLRNLRLEEARGLLHYSSLSVTEIAEQLGYPSIHDFSREFSRALGRSPSKYAKEQPRLS